MNPRIKPWALKLCAAAVLGTGSLGANAAFSIALTFSGLTPTQQSYFGAAASFWENVITGYKPLVTLTGLSISASGVPIDGSGGVLGSAGPDSITQQQLTRYTTTGSMEFDTADINTLIGNGSFANVIKHEMAHVIGFGTLWSLNNLYVNTSGRYTGVNGLLTYRSEFNQPLALFVPVELGGGGGTADGHWNEVDGGGGNTGITDTQGRDMRLELMTGWLNEPAFVSRMTAAQFQDLGYVVNLSAVPEPAALALLLAGIPMVAGVALRRRRHLA